MLFNLYIYIYIYTCGFAAQFACPQNSSRLPSAFHTQELMAEVTLAELPIRCLCEFLGTFLLVFSVPWLLVIHRIHR